ncbi:MAG: UPF0262 family protein [Rhodospirillaceae bacterium]|nr:UPF0262 family protein [Rhodospirillaceae bacterium]
MSPGPDDDRASVGNGSPTTATTNSIVKITLDEGSFLRRRPEVEHEREVALFDLLEQNHFELIDDDDDAVPGPYHVVLSLREDRLVFALSTPAGVPIQDIALPTRPFRSVIKDYFLVCESYFDAIKTLTPAQIESIDMGRRSLHNEGAQKLEDRLSEHVNLDSATARRLFTLLCVLHMRG